MPGQEYVLPPQQEKMNPLEAQEEDVLRGIDFNAGKLDKQLVSNFCWSVTGIGKGNSL